MFQKSLIRNYFLSSMLFGIVMGCIFPVYAYFFVDFKSHVLMIWFVVGCIVAGIMVGLFSFIIAKITVLNSVKKIAHTLENVSDTHDLTQRVHIESHDEIGILAKSSNQLLDRFTKIISHLKSNNNMLQPLLGAIQNSNRELEEVATAMVERSVEFKEFTDTLNSSMSKVAEMSEISSQDMGSIAAAVTSMSATIDKISQETETASEKTRLAVASSVDNFRNIKFLDEIGETTTSILESVDTITKQTELIAVNANIEAVRAGSAGKAFAVVAAEVKNLAEETTKAVNQIRTLVDTMSQSTGKTTENMHEIDSSLNEINKIVVSIKEEIKLQNVDADSISSSVDDSLIRVVSSSRRVHESAAAVDSMKTHMDTIMSTAQRAKATEELLSHAIWEFESVSDDLQKTIDMFKTE